MAICMFCGTRLITGRNENEQCMQRNPSFRNLWPRHMWFSEIALPSDEDETLNEIADAGRQS